VGNRKNKKDQGGHKNNGQLRKDVVRKNEELKGGGKRTNGLTTKWSKGNKRFGARGKKKIIIKGSSRYRRVHQDI